MTQPSYTVTRSKRRSIAIHLRDGQVQVRAPLFVSNMQIAAFVSSRADWIAKYLPQSIAQNPWADGMQMSILGKNWQMRWRESTGRPRLLEESESQTLWLLSPTWCCEQARRLLLRWLSARARAHLQPLLQAQAQQMGVAERLSGVVLRYTKTMWGRCSARGEVLLNPAVLLTSDDCIHYLLVHELAHLQHMNHSPAFWQLVERFCPNWRQARTQLRQHKLGWLH